MPELPEVETIKRSLEPLVKDKIISDVEIYYDGIIKYPQPEKFKEMICGRKIIDINRRGKYLLFHLDDNNTLVIHLRMTGQLIVCDRDISFGKHTHLIFRISSRRDLRFTDIRKFGTVYLVPTSDWTRIKGLQNLGYEPLSKKFNFETLKNLITGRKRLLKVFLLDQSKIAGIGNIYADEILFSAGLHPKREIQMLTQSEITNLYNAITQKLEEGIKYRGTSFSDYVDGRGEKGSYQEKLHVYGRGGKPCLKCGALLEKSIIAGRGTVFCPKCQS